MRELVLQMGVSIDGYVAAVDGAHDWGYDGEDPAMTGLPLFKDLPSRLALELIEARTYSTGAAVHVYRPR